jgi:hypothetical protein
MNREKLIPKNAVKQQPANGKDQQQDQAHNTTVTQQFLGLNRSHIVIAHRPESEASRRLARTHIEEVGGARRVGSAIARGLR